MTTKRSAYLIGIGVLLGLGVLAVSTWLDPAEQDLEDHPVSPAPASVPATGDLSGPEDSDERAQAVRRQAAVSELTPGRGGTTEAKTSTPRTQTGLGTLAGIVSQSTGEPVQGALVEVSVVRYRGADVYEAPWKARTDRNGRFVIRDVDAGAFALVASAESYSASDPLRLTLDAAGEQLDLKLELRPGGRIEGVIWNAGEPAADLRVAVGPRTTQTDNSGTFGVDGLPAGHHEVSARIPVTDPGATGLLRETVRVRPGEVVPVTLGVPPGRIVRVEGELQLDGVPAVGYAVSIALQIPESPAFLARAETDGTGHFQFTVPFPGEAILRFQQSGRTIVARRSIGGGPQEWLAFDYRLGVLEGTVVDDLGQPLSRVSIGARRRVDSPTEDRCELQMVEMTADDGRFQVELLPGIYDLSARCYPLHAEDVGRWHIAEIPDVEIQPGQTHRLEIRLPTAGSCRGQVLDPDGSGVGGIEILCSDSGRGFLSSAAAVSQADGRFEVRGLDDGRYLLTAVTGKLVAAPVVAEVPDEKEIVLSLLPGAVLAIGFDSPDDLAALRRVDVIDGQGRRWPNWRRFGGSTEDMALGRILYGPLPEGRYTVTGQFPGRERTSVEVSVPTGSAEVSVHLKRQGGHP